MRDTIIFRGKKAKVGPVHTMNITLGHILDVFFPRDFNDKYGYLGYIYTSERGEYSKVIRPLILAMDKKAKPWWCPRWFLRFLELFGNDNSIVRVRNFKLHNLHRKITKGYRFIDWKTKWDWYDLRISIYACKELQDMADKIESDFYRENREKDGEEN
jgi:hypothetical protein